MARCIDEEMAAFKRQVLHFHIDNTSTIDKIPPTKGVIAGKLICVQQYVRI